MQNNSEVKTKEVEDHRRNFKFSNKTSVTACNDSFNAKTSNVISICETCGKCVFNANHDLCVLNYIIGVNSRTKKPTAVHISTRKPKQTVNQSVATPHRRTVASESIIQKPRSTLRKLYEHVSKTCSWWYTKITPPGYKWVPKYKTRNVKPDVSVHLGNEYRTTNILESKTVRGSTLSNTPLSSNSFALRIINSCILERSAAAILGYGDLVQVNITIKRVYYVEGLYHNLFSVDQFCDADLEVAFRKSTCYVHDLKGIDLHIGSRGTDLYSITLQETTSPNPICLMAKASSSQAWLWHHRLSHLKFDTINLLSKNDIVNGLPKLKFVKDHLCSSCELGKAKRKSFKTKTTPSSKGQLQLLHMDLCGPMMIEIINGKKYVLTTTLEYDNLSLDSQSRANVPLADETVTKLLNELVMLFSLMFDEYLNGATSVVSMSFVVPTADASDKLQTRRQLEIDDEMCMFSLTVSRTEPKNIKEAMTDHASIEATQEELHQFERLEAKEINFKESFTPVAWLEAPDGFVDPHNPDKVYHLKKALYGLKQALRAWYDQLSNFLVSKGFSKGSIDPTLFITKHEEDILLVQIYVDDIIFRSTNPKLSKKFEKLMHNKFEMSMMRELKFFLGIWMYQSLRGIFINQAKYTQEILKKHGMTSCDSIGTLMATKPLDVNLSGTPVHQRNNRSMVRLLMYLIESRPDIVHATCYYARYKARPTEKHLNEDTGFELTTFSYSDHASCLDTRKSTSGAKAEYVSLSACCAQVLWMRTHLTDYGFYFDKIPMYCDSKVKRGIVELFFIGTKYQLADLFTKILSEDRFKYLVKRLVTLDCNPDPNVTGECTFQCAYSKIEEKSSIMNIEKYFKRETPCTSTSDDVTKQATKEKPKQLIDVIDLNNLPWDPVNRPRISQYNVNQRDDIRRKYWNRGPCQPSGHDFKRTIIGKAYCLCCYLFRDDFGRQGGNKASIKKGLMVERRQKEVKVMMEQAICVVNSMLVVVAVARKHLGVVNFFDKLALMTNVVCASCKRKDILIDSEKERVEKTIGNGEVETERGKNQELSLIRAGDTRWNSHYKIIFRLIDLLPSVIRHAGIPLENMRFIVKSSGDLSTDTIWLGMSFLTYVGVGCVISARK
ncbi:retrovirus-related pol polyprotein from transposon TNT 1-94 [Tanacetum coccineum]